MFNIKIKSIPNKAKTGSQLDYSLVDRNTLFLKPSNTNNQSDIKNTIGGVPRDEANIEAEGGETVIGDLNNDGLLEHNTIVGKRHSKGGVPMNVPDGSFIFSDTPSLRIKDPEVFSIFGMKPNKKGYTPAEIAKKYQINDYIAILKDEAKDKYAKQTAQVMLDSNLKKLGMLALVQESMKGFPDGVPAIAESAVAGLSSAPQEDMGEEQQEMQRGGTPKYSKEGPSLWRDIKESAKATLDAIEEQGVGEYIQNWWENKDKNSKKPKAAPVKKPKADVSDEYLRKLAYKEYKNRKDPSPTLEQLKALKQKELEAIRQKENFNYESLVGKKIYSGNKPYTVTGIDLNALNSNLSSALNDENADIIKLKSDDGEEAAMSMRMWQSISNNKKINLPGQSQYLDFTTTPKNLKRNLNKDLHVETGDILNYDGNKYTVINPWGENSYEYKTSGKRWKDIFDNTQGIIHVKDEQGNDVFIEGEDLKQSKKFLPSSVKITRSPNNFIDWAKFKKNTGTEGVVQKTPVQDLNDDNSAKPANQEPKRRTYKSPLKRDEPVVKKTTPVSATPASEDVWTDEEFKYGGLTKYEQAGPVTEPPGKTWTGKYQYSKKTGNRRKIYTDGTFGPSEKVGVTYDTADEKARALAEKLGYIFVNPVENLRYKEKQVGPQTKNTGYEVDPESGYRYKDIKPGLAGLEDVYRRHKEIIDQYPGGFEAWKKTQIEAGGKENPAQKFLVDRVNMLYKALTGTDLVDVNKPGAYIPGVELFNLPGIQRTPAVAQTPAKRDVEVVNPTRPPQENVFNDDGWWLQDRLTFAGNLTDNINRYDPVMAAYQRQFGDVAYEDPTRQLAANQSAMSQMNNMFQNSMANNTFAATVLANSGQGFENAANVIGGVENRNVGTYNNYADRFAQRANEYDQLIQNAKQLYNNQMVTGLQQYDNARRAQKWNVINAYNTGVTNNMRKRQQEQILTPQAHIDPITGDVMWTGRTRNMFGEDVYSPAYKNSNSFNPAAYYEAYKNAGYSPEEAMNLLKIQAGQKRASASNYGGMGYPGANSAYGAYAASPYDEYDV